MWGLLPIRDQYLASIPYSSASPNCLCGIPSFLWFLTTVGVLSRGVQDGDTQLTVLKMAKEKDHPEPELGITWSWE